MHTGLACVVHETYEGGSVIEVGVKHGTSTETLLMRVAPPMGKGAVGTEVEIDATTISGPGWPTKVLSGDETHTVKHPWS